MVDNYDDDEYIDGASVVIGKDGSINLCVRGHRDYAEVELSRDDAYEIAQQLIKAVNGEMVYEPSEEELAEQARQPQDPHWHLKQVSGDDQLYGMDFARNLLKTRGYVYVALMEDKNTEVQAPGYKRWLVGESETTLEWVATAAVTVTMLGLSYEPDSRIQAYMRLLQVTTALPLDKLVLQFSVS